MASAEVAYYTYIYSKVDKVHYRKITSFVHSAIIIGNLTAAASSQVLVSTNVADYLQLNYITIGSCTMALMLSAFLPSVEGSLYFHNMSNVQTEISKSVRPGIFKSVRIAYIQLWRDTRDAYRKTALMEWPIWLAIVSVGSYQVKNYAQSL